MLFRGYQENYMKEKMGMTRLTVASTKGLQEVCVPSLTGKLRERYFLFSHEGSYEAEDPGIDIKAKAMITFDEQKTLLAAEDNLWPGHAEKMTSTQMAADSSMQAVKAAMNKKELPRWGDWLHDFKEMKLERSQKPESRAQSTKADVLGAAAGEFVVVRGDGSVGVSTSSGQLDMDLSDLAVQSSPAKLMRGKSSADLEGGSDNGNCDDEEEDFAEESAPGGHQIISFIIV